MDYVAAQPHTYALFAQEAPTIPPPNATLADILAGQFDGVHLAEVVAWRLGGGPAWPVLAAAGANEGQPPGVFLNTFQNVAGIVLSIRKSVARADRDGVLK